MEIRANYLMVGLFAIAVLLGAMGFVLWLGDDDKDIRICYYDITVNESVKGLSVNGDVLFSGLRVGKVDNIEISRVTPGSVSVRIAIDAATPVRENSAAQLELRGITGATIISISGGTADSPLVNVPDNTVGKIPYAPSPLSSAMAQMPDVLASANLLLQRMDMMFSEKNAKSLETMLASLATLSETLGDRAETIDTILVETGKVSVQLDDILRNINSLLATDVKNAGRSFNSAAKRLDSTLKVIEPGVKQFSTQGLSDMRMLMVEMRNMVHMLTRVGQKLESDPRRFFFGDPVKEYRSK